MATGPHVFDHPALDARRRRALRAATPGAAFLLERVADDLAERLTTIRRRFEIAVEVGGALPVLAARAMATGQVGRIFRMDRVGASRPDVVGDGELFPFREASLDLVLSALSFQFANDLPGSLTQIRRALKPDGLLLAAFAGGDTLRELRESLAAAEAEVMGGAAPRVAPFAEVRTVGGLLQRAGFALPVTDQDRLVIRYADMFGLMRDLRAMGATNGLVERSRRSLRRDVLFRAAAIYAERFADPDGRVRASFDIISLSGWVPDGSQPKPLPPGSARVRLADAIGAVEHPAGEKAGR